MNEDMRREDEGPKVCHAVISSLTDRHEVMIAHDTFEALNLRVIKLEQATQLHVGISELFGVIVLPVADVVEDDVRKSTWLTAQSDGLGQLGVDVPAILRDANR